MVKRMCETCGKDVKSFVIFECVNPSCDIPQHTVCIEDFLYIHLDLRELLAG